MNHGILNRSQYKPILGVLINKKRLQHFKKLKTVLHWIFQDRALLIVFFYIFGKALKFSLATQPDELSYFIQGFAIHKIISFRHWKVNDNMWRIFSIPRVYLLYVLRIYIWQGNGLVYTNISINQYDNNYLLRLYYSTYFFVWITSKSFHTRI